MSELSDTPATGTPETAPAAPAEETAAGSQPENQTTPPATEDKPAEPVKPSVPSGEPEKPKESGQPADSKPKSRRSAQFRIEQLARENASLRKEKGLPPRTEPTDNPDDGNPPAEPPQPDIGKQVSEEVDRRLAPVLSEHSRAADDSELNELFVGDRASDRSRIEPQIRDMWKLPQYKDVAAIDLYKMLAFDSIGQRAVEEHKKATKEAKEHSTGGTSARKSDDSQSAWNMTDEEFQKKNNEVRASGLMAFIRH